MYSGIRRFVSHNAPAERDEDSFRRPYNSTGYIILPSGRIIMNIKEESS